MKFNNLNDNDLVDESISHVDIAEQINTIVNSVARQKVEEFQEQQELERLIIDCLYWHL